MGWGCYKHEWDEGSDHWKEFADKLCNEKLQEHPRTPSAPSRISTTHAPPTSKPRACAGGWTK